ncbi:MAG TPA: hypothetical protein VFP22_02870 [Candidatus Limnocylindrales bacterium]|nr:hypothetical protein [Candidatus Limnocylindrales bacterium]
MKIEFFAPPSRTVSVIADWPNLRIPVVGDHLDLVFRSEDVDVMMNETLLPPDNGTTVSVAGAVVDVIWRRVPSGNDAFWSVTVRLK